MRRFLLVLAFAMALSSCDEITEDADSRFVEEVDAGTDSVSFFHLECTGTENFDNISFEEKTVLLAVPEKQAASNAVYEFREDDQLYYGFCSTKMYDCLFDINRETITGFGSDTFNGFTTSSSLLINRITGHITKKFNAGGTITTFEGHCEPANPPEIAAPKF